MCVFLVKSVFLSFSNSIWYHTPFWLYACSVKGRCSIIVMEAILFCYFINCYHWKSSRVNFIISYSHMWWHFIDQLFLGQTANLIQPFLLVNEVGGAAQIISEIFSMWFICYLINETGITTAWTVWICQIKLFFWEEVKLFYFELVMPVSD